jgi:diguanylate cyclase (GGDEF)-like protein
MAMFGWEYSLFSDRVFSAEDIMESFTEYADAGEGGGYLLRGMDRHPLSDNTVTLPIPRASLAMVFILDELYEAVFIFDSFTTENAFDESDMRKLSRYRRHAVSALVKARTVQQLRETSDKLIQANRELHRLSSRDGLTGVANRRYLDEMIDIEWQRAKRLETETAFLMIDIDYFKRYNDEFGHQRGDDCLKAVARVLERGVDRSADFVARYGGEEFVVLLPATGLEGAFIVAERLRVAVESLEIRHPTSDVSNVITVSIGVASILYSSDETLASLIDTADRALYSAKQRGRNRVCRTT